MNETESQNTEGRVETYRSALYAVYAAAAILKVHDLPTILESIASAHAVGPFVDPTLYRDKSEAMDQDSEALRAALPLWKFGLKMGALQCQRWRERVEPKGQRP